MSRAYPQMHTHTHAHTRTQWLAICGTPLRARTFPYIFPSSILITTELAFCLHRSRLRTAPQGDFTGTSGPITDYLGGHRRVCLNTASLNYSLSPVGLRQWFVPCAVVLCSPSVHSDQQKVVSPRLYSPMLTPVADPEGGGVRGFKPPFRGCCFGVFCLSVYEPPPPPPSKNSGPEPPPP